MVLKKTLSPQEALEYIAYAVLVRDLPEGFDGNITCEYIEDGSINITADEDQVKPSKNLILN